MWESILTEWASLILRWLHVVAAVGWIGSSFYFIHLDLSLKPRGDLPEGAYGEAWQVHGGGFYRIVKYLVAPARMPDELTWFKWEAYTTWLSGFALLVIVYYLGAELYLIDKSVLNLTAPTATAIAFVSLALAWLMYEALCRSALGRHEVALALVGYVFLVGLTYGFTHVFSGRGAFTQIGALIGTIMVANVFVIVIPNQKKTVAALLAAPNLERLAFDDPAQPNTEKGLAGILDAHPRSVDVSQPQGAGLDPIDVPKQQMIGLTSHLIDAVHVHWPQRMAFIDRQIVRSPVDLACSGMDDDDIAIDRAACF